MRDPDSKDKEMAPEEQEWKMGLERWENELGRFIELFSLPLTVDD